MATWVNVTLAPETTAPVSSTTVPSIVPVVICDCDQSGWEENSNINVSSPLSTCCGKHITTPFRVEEYKGTLVKKRWSGFFTPGPIYGHGVKSK